MLTVATPRCSTNKEIPVSSSHKISSSTLWNFHPSFQMILQGFPVCRFYLYLKIEMGQDHLYLRGFMKCKLRTMYSFR